MPRVDLSDKPIAITGASSGIGAATALACARAGMPVALFARREDKLAQVASRIEEAGGRAIVVPGSVEDPGDCERLIDETARAFGAVYSVYANAGYGQESDTWSMPDADVRAMFEVNVYGSLNAIRPAIEGMIERGTGHVIMCSSCLAKLGVPRYGCYCATKAVQDLFCRAMRHELKSKGVAVSSVHPIGTKTEFFDVAAERSEGGTTMMDRGSQRFMQPASKVADAIVRQLRRGKGAEVWTSLPARLGFAASAVWPRLTDEVLGLAYRKRAGADL